LLTKQEQKPYKFTFFSEKEIILKGTNISINYLNDKIQDNSELKNIELENMINEI